MVISIAWGTKIVSVPQADLTFITGTLYELDTEVFRLAIKALEAGVDGMPELDVIDRNPPYTVAGVQYAQKLEVINGYTITFEDGQYAVSLVGSNNNFFEEGILNRNQVSIIANNAAGLQLVSVGSGLSVEEQAQLKDLHQFRGLDADNPLSITDAVQTVDGKVVTVTDNGTTTTIDRA